ncbi:rhodanese-like domain-containing protein [Pelagibius sp. Alg239-R121]|uniref:rhodanese-like domain-containing protein n=1 Tax=Pelagibius sp. Alg239-R121 TaxID=2993448 RepID=UPI0024A6E4AE|nr:rhodanese-like domain-containing protein [Pelagibius sp. Alg239-R121]
MTDDTNRIADHTSRRRLLLGLLGIVTTASILPFRPMAAAAAGKSKTETATASTDISGPEALALSQRGEMTIVDVRSPQEWKQTGLPSGAQAVTIHDPEGLEGFVRALKRSVGDNLDTPVALICARGNRSTRAQNALRAAGFTRVLNIKEGMLGSTGGPGWLARKLPVDRCTRC